jgi:hypothetical protein
MAQHRDIDALIAWLETVARRPFSWRWHCVRKAAEAVKVQGGGDFLPGIACRSKRAARALIEAEGGLEAAVDRRLTRIPPALASRGDIAGVPDDEFGIRLLVVEGATLVGPGATGAQRLPRSMMTMAWSAMPGEAG